MTTFNTQYVFTAKTEQLLNKLRTVQNSMAAVSKKARAIGDSLDSMSGRMVGLGTKAAAAVVTATVPLYSLQKETNKMVAASGKSFKEMQGVIDLASKLGATTEHSSLTAMRAATKFAQAGLKTKDIMNLMPQALTMATAGGIELADAADMLTTSVAAFQLPTSDSVKIIDLLAEGAASAKLDMIDFKEMISKVGAVSGIAGMDINKSTAAFMALRTRGLEASIAANGLASLMTRMSAPAKDARKAYHELGIPIEKMQAKGAKFEEVMRRLAPAIQKATKEGKNMGPIAKAIFGLEQQKIGLHLVNAFNLGDADKGFDSYLKVLGKSQGAAKRMQDVMNTGIVGAFKRATSALGGLDEKMGKSGLTETIIRLLDKFTELVTKLKNSDTDWNKLIKNVFLVITALLGFGIAAKAISMGMAVFSGISTVASALAGAPAIITAVGSAIAFVGEVIGIAFAANPVGLIVTAIAAVAAGVYYAVRYWDEIVAFFTSVVDKFKSVYN